MNLTNKQQLPSPFFHAVEEMERRYKEDDRGDITTTTLLDPPQVVALKKRHDKELSEDVIDRLWALQGQIMHMVLELAAPKGTQVENRIGVEVNGWKVTGKYDLIEGDTLYDYKYTTVWSYVFGKPEWAEQANVNRWLLHKNGTEINRLILVLMFRDFVESKVGSKNYPANKVVQLEVPLWTLDKAEEFIKDRVKLHQKAEELADEDLPPCSKTERWWNERKGIFQRCENYCAAKEFCAQYKRS